MKRKRQKEKTGQHFVEKIINVRGHFDVGVVQTCVHLVDLETCSIFTSRLNINVRTPQSHWSNSNVTCWSVQPAVREVPAVAIPSQDTMNHAKAQDCTAPAEPKAELAGLNIGGGSNACGKITFVPWP